MNRLSVVRLVLQSVYLCSCPQISNIQYTNAPRTLFVKERALRPELETFPQLRIICRVAATQVLKRTNLRTPTQPCLSVGVKLPRQGK